MNDSMWRELHFQEVLAPVNTRGSRVDASEYSGLGRYPVVDQSKALIAGFASPPLKAIRPGPEGMIVFGDHTCVTKFVDFDFLSGADGTKVLRPILGNSVRLRYIAYSLELNPVLSTGYNRHFSLLRERKFRIPTLEEQDKAVQILNGVDKAILSEEGLLEKKLHVMTGVMQNLLTGAKRLPGFTDNWTLLNVGERSQLKARIGWQGLTTGEYRASGEFRLVGGASFSAGRVNWTSTPFVDKSRFDQDTNIQLRKGDVLVTKDGSIGKVAFVDHLPGPTTLNSGVFVIRPLAQSYDPGFLYFLLNSRMFEEFIERLSAGSTISHLYQRDLSKLSFMVPARLDEQLAIADVLFSMDADIYASRSLLQKLQELKKGMMQELLTERAQMKSAVA